MRLLFVADGVSPIARSWIQHFADSDHEVHLISSRPCEEIEGTRSLSVVPVAFSGLGGRKMRDPGDKSVLAGSGTIGLRTFMRHWLGPLTVNRAARKVSEIATRIQPDLLHAMRIPFEGAMAAASGAAAPLVISVWGNDFTLHAPASPGMRAMTRRTVAQTAGLHTDCRRDQRLAIEFGYREAQPSLVSPGNGGVRLELFHRGRPGLATDEVLQTALRSIAQDQPVIVNPRGFRGYVRNDVFFRAIPLILDHHPEAIFLCVGMLSDRRAERWTRTLGIADSVRLLPSLTPIDMAVVFRRSEIMVSPSLHDGTPNSLLEAMACGSYPVAGELESIKEWIDAGRNGTLIDARQPSELAQAVIQAVANPEHRAQAAELNSRIIAERAEYLASMARAEAFYRSLLN
jgi:glycosyltransferase involved in cell wall biosynthesis